MKKILTLLLFSFFLTHAQATEQCKNLKPDLWVNAEFAINGSTLIIQNQRVHLIGLYAPQKARTYKFNTPGQPLAKESQDNLNRLIANHDLKLGIVYDTNKTNPNRIQQVHAFFEDGTSLNAEMIRSGFALNYTQNDNLSYAKCYFSAEKEARNNGYQLWDYALKHPDVHFPLVLSSEITTEDQGFRIIQGEILGVSKSATNYIINMDTTGIRIPKKYWSKFDYAKLQQLKGKTIEVRGFAYLYKGHMYVIVKEPYNIDAFNPLSASQ